MPNLTPQLNTVMVEATKLILDPNNPRMITRDSDKRTESALDVSPDTMERMQADKYKIGELKNSILQNGWLPIDSIFVRELDGEGRYLVLEGNRRVTAIRQLLRDDDLPSKIRSQLTTIQVMEVTGSGTDEDLKTQIVYLLGVRHHGSLKKWSPFAQASNIYNRYMELSEVDEFAWADDIGQQVANALNISKKEVEARLKVYSVMRHLGKSPTINESQGHGGGIKDRYYSVIAEVVLNSTRYSSYININQDDFSPNEESLARMINLCHFDQPNREGAPINNPMEWRKLSDILKDQDPEKKKGMLQRVEVDKEKPSDVYAERAVELQTTQWDHWLQKVHSVLAKVQFGDVELPGAREVIRDLSSILDELSENDFA